jgi:hypothetical protein
MNIPTSRSSGSCMSHVQKKSLLCVEYTSIPYLIEVLELSGFYYRFKQRLVAMMEETHVKIPSRDGFLYLVVPELTIHSLDSLEHMNQYMMVKH